MVLWSVRGRTGGGGLRRGRLASVRDDRRRKVVERTNRGSSFYLAGGHQARGKEACDRVPGECYNVSSALRVTSSVALGPILCAPSRPLRLSSIEAGPRAIKGQRFALINR